MALTLQKNKTIPVPTPGPAPSATPTPSVPLPPLGHTRPAYRGDVGVFMLWMGCFLLMASMILYETAVGLLFRK